MTVSEQHYQVRWEEFRVDVYRSFSSQLTWQEIVSEAFEAFRELAPDFCTLEAFEEQVTVSIIVNDRKMIDCEIDCYSLERDE